MKNEGCLSIDINIIIDISIVISILNHFSGSENLKQLGLPSFVLQSARKFTLQCKVQLRIN